MPGSSTFLCIAFHLSFPVLPFTSLFVFLRCLTRLLLLHSIPWNYPIQMWYVSSREKKSRSILCTEFDQFYRAWKVSPALACGCTIVMKPSEWTPLTVQVCILSIRFTASHFARYFGFVDDRVLADNGFARHNPPICVDDASSTFPLRCSFSLRMLWVWAIASIWCGFT